MKARTSFLKRCLAMVLAVMLLVSGTNMGVVLQVYAAGATKSVSSGEIVAANYALTDAEKALLSSGHLAGVTEVTTTEPDNSWGTADAETKTITAKEEDGWKAVKADIIVGGETVETVNLTDGKGTYTENVGNAFSVKIYYELLANVENQDTLLNTAAWLKQGVANADEVAAQDGNLYILEQAMPELVKFANEGIKVEMQPGVTTTIGFSDVCKAAVEELNDQMTANGGKLDLSVTIDAYANAPKVAFVLNEGKAMKAQVVELIEKVALINEVMTKMTDELGLMISMGWVSEAQANQLKTFSGVTKNLMDGLAGVAAKEWTASEKGKALLQDSEPNYKEIDTLVAALGETTPAPAVKNPLKVADATIQVNMSMKNVKVTVYLTKVQPDTPDEDLLVQHGNETVVTLTLAEGATKAEIEAELAKVEAKEMDRWASEYADVYKAEHYGPYYYNALPDTLTEDIEYVIEYRPAYYTITMGYDDPMTVHYGYQYTLPKHENSEQAYDYTVNGAAYAQGEVVVIKGDTEITRTSGKSYGINTTQYQVVADNYGANDITKNILTSGALKNDQAISARKPDPADAASLLELKDGELKAKDFDSSYKGLPWKPATYGVNGTENAFSGNPAWTGKDVKVQYKLTLTNFSVEKVEEILALAKNLKDEFDAQKSAMDSLLGMKDTLDQLDKTKLGALNGVIDVTDFSTDPAENEAIKAEMKAIVSAIIANNLEGSALRITTMVANYNNNGMRYYYENYAAIKKEVESLAGYLTNLMHNEEALKTMCNAAGYGEYADKISDVEGKLNTYNANLSAPNAAIDVSSPNLGKLLTALDAKDEVAVKTAGHPYILSDVLTAMDQSQVNVQVIINVPGNSATVTTESMDKGTVLTQKVITDLKAAVEAKVNELLGENVKYYNLDAPIELDALVGTELNAQNNIYYTYTEKEYTVVIDGEADQIVTISDLEINLPKHPTQGWKYYYTVDGVEGIEADTYTFTTLQLDKLFVNGKYTITRTAKNVAEEKVEGAFPEEWQDKDGDGNLTGLYAKVDGDKDGIMDFAMTLVDAGYTYIGLNGEGLLYLNAENSLEISLQTLVNAIMNDNQFGSNTLITLGKDGKGEFVHAKMQLGTAKDNLDYSDLDFTLYLNSVPSQMATVGSGLAKFQNYMTFKAQDGTMMVNLNLPDKVYGAFLAALLATGNADKENVEAVNAEIAYQFLWDYVTKVITNEDINTTSLTNTLKKLGRSEDLTGAEKYYQMVRKALTHPGVKVNEDENDKFEMNVTGNGQSGINKLIGMLGIDTSSFNTYLEMIKEYKGEGSDLTVKAEATLDNTAKTYQALVLDLNATETTNKFDYVTDLSAKTVSEDAVIILVGDVKGNLNFGSKRVFLDLNGRTVNGNVTGSNLYIIDSRMETKAGSITGSVKAAAIFGGTYGDTAGAAAAVKDGYKLVDGTVQNALYTIEKSKARAAGDNYTIVVNAGILNEEIPSYKTFAKALAVDVAVDLALNYYTAAALAVDGNEMYRVEITELIGLLTGTNRKEAAIDKILACIKADGISKVTNNILDDLMDFTAIANALRAGTPVGEYQLTTTAWGIDVVHVKNGNYVDFNVSASGESKTTTLGIAFTGNTEPVAKRLAELGDIANVDINVTLDQPNYDNNKFTVTGSADATIGVDVSKKPDYAKMLGVILAYGNPDKAKDVAEAINNDKVNDLKAVVDNTTVAELFTALKAMSRNVSFADMAKKVGATKNIASATELEGLYHLALCASGKALEELKITGMDSKLGGLYQNGAYVLTRENMIKSGDVSYGGYSAHGEVKLTNFTMIVKLFDDVNCIWGDINHDGFVNSVDASLIVAHRLGNRDPMIKCLLKADVNQDGYINTTDASLIVGYRLGNIPELPYVIDGQ